MEEGIGDVDIARPVHRHVRGAMELRPGRRHPIPAAVIARARNRGDRPRRIHLWMRAKQDSAM